MIQDRAGLRVELRDELGDDRRVGEQVGDGGDVVVPAAAGGDAELAGERLDPRGGYPVSRRRDRCAEPAEPGPDDVVEAAQGSQRVVGAPEQGQCAEPGEGLVDVRAGGVDAFAQQVGGRRATEGERRVHHGQLELRELVDRPEHGSPGADARGELGGVVRGRGREVRTCREQAGDLFVRPAAKLVGEGAWRVRRRRRHPDHDTDRPGRRMPGRADPPRRRIWRRDGGRGVASGTQSPGSCGVPLASGYD